MGRWILTEISSIRETQSTNMAIEQAKIIRDSVIAMCRSNVWFCWLRNVLYNILEKKEISLVSNNPIDNFRSGPNSAGPVPDICDQSQF